MLLHQFYAIVRQKQYRFHSIFEAAVLQGLFKRQKAGLAGKGSDLPGLVLDPASRLLIVGSSFAPVNLLLGFLLLNK